MYTYQEEKNIVNALKHQCCLSQLMDLLIKHVSHFKGFEQNDRVVFYQEQLHSRVNCALDEFVSMMNWIHLTFKKFDKRTTLSFDISFKWFKNIQVFKEE